VGTGGIVFKTVRQYGLEVPRNMIWALFFRCMGNAVAATGLTYAPCPAAVTPSAAYPAARFSQRLHAFLHKGDLHKLPTLRLIEGSLQYRAIPLHIKPYQQ
jgi:hypothetical protein